MSVLLDERTRVIVQGLTGKEGTFHAQQMIAYNTGTYNHTIEVRFLTELPAEPSLVAPPPISNQDLSSPAPVLQ